jgi:hypothetical protein
MGQVHLLHDDGYHGGGGEEEKVKDEADEEGEGEHEAREAAGFLTRKRTVVFFHNSRGKQLPSSRWNPGEGKRGAFQESPLPGFLILSDNGRKGKF